MKTKKELEEEIEKLQKINQQNYLSEDELQRIKTSLSDVVSDYINDISKTVEKRIFDNIINWCAKKLIQILISAFIIIAGLCYKFISEHEQIQSLKIENQNIKIECQNRINDLKFQLKQGVKNNH